MTRPRLMLLVLLCATSVAAALVTLPAAPAPPSGVRPAPQPVEAPAQVAASWKEVDRLLGEQKLAEAAKILDRLEPAARERGDDADLARVLIRQTQVAIALGGYETAVESLRAKSWPEQPLARAQVELYDAHALARYLDAYGWEIAQRERVVSGEKLDLKLWTRDQLAAEVDRAFARVWALRAELGELPASGFAELAANSYPERIRPSLRDAVAYLWAERLSDSADWSPAELAETWKLDRAALIDGTAAEASPERLSDAGLHPLVKLAAILGDLERWHRGREETGAALEARLERLQRLHGALSANEDREALRAALAESLPEFRSDPWWGMGQAALARMWLQGEGVEDRIRARELAIAGEHAFPGTPGARACRRVRAEVEAPAYDLEAMTIDAPDRRSVRISHRNLAQLHFRAYRLEDEPFADRPVNWNGWNQDRIKSLLRRSPAARWTLELPPTRDYRDHHSFTTPPLDERGRYVIVASPEPGFGESGNFLRAVEVSLSDLILLRDPSFGQTDSTTVVRAVSGSTGEPLAGVDARLYRWQWEHRPELVETTTTDRDGLARFSTRDTASGGRGVAVVLRHRGEEAVWSQGWGWNRATAASPGSSGTLLFTDRSIYRPGQTLYWKLLAWTGERLEGRLRAQPGRSLRVELVDPNGEVVASGEGTTNDFGAASGELVVPPGRLLGNWILRSAGSSASISVEEYKRPTFEVALEAPTGEPRLNRPVELPGEARYYFGLPVAAGRVAWRVTRAPLWEPRGWWWWRPPAPPRTIASGTSELAADGSFSVRFTPEADERERGACGCFRFTVEAEVTDDGGETRSGSRSLALGWVGVRLAVEGDPFLLGPASERTWKLSRLDLDGQARPGATSWRLVEIEQPEVAPLPAELPERLAPELEPWATPGDSVRPRWAPAPPSEQLLAGWPAGRQVAHGELAHGEDGLAALQLPDLAPGAYRLYATTRDAHGESFELERSFAVAGGPGERSDLAVPLELRFEAPSVAVGGTARLFVHSGRRGQRIVLEIVRGAQVRERRLLVAGRDPEWIELPIRRGDRGGFGARAAIVADHQIVQRNAGVAVPWDDRALEVELASFRDKLEPGATETFRVAVRDPQGRPLGADAAELLASMYDRSLDLFRPHTVPLVSSLYPHFGAPGVLAHELAGRGSIWAWGRSWAELPGVDVFRADAYVAIDPYGIGGPGLGGGRFLARGDVAYEMAARPASAPAPRAQGMAAKSAVLDSAEEVKRENRQEGDTATMAAGEAPVELRSDFSETAFFQPHLVTGEDGSAAIEFQVPDSLTSWKLWIAAWTRDLASGSLEQEIRTAKELMVRPYLPRFLREGDRAALKVVVNNASERELSGDVLLKIVDADTEQDLSAEFGLPAGGGRARFDAEPGAGDDLGFEITAPRGLRTVAFRVEARADGLSDGELRPLPVLPSRIRLAQSRFAALRGGERRELVFDDLRADDPTRIDERMVVTVDGQLFYGMLDALPYLVDYPYECTEQTMNRFVSTGILGSLFERYPAVAKMAKQLSERDTRWERFDQADPNRRMALEETPWLRQARGGEGTTDEALLRVLDPAVSRAVEDEALAKLRKAQLPSGAFPWFPGGPPSPYMTLYLMYGFSHAAEFGVEIPEEVVVRGWRYLATEIEHDWWKKAIADDCCWETLTFANYVASSYPDAKWMGDVFPASKRREILDFSFKHWRDHSPMLKLQLAMTLQRMERPKDARLVLESVMDSARTDRDLGTYWAPEDRAWLWYNDTIETHAWALRALLEITPDDPRKEGLVQWLFLNKKLGHWKSTRATSEVLFSLATYLEREKLLGSEERLAVVFGGRTTEFLFEPDRFTGKKNQIVLEGDQIVPERDATIVVAQETPGFAFASATWHFSTEQMPREARGDLFHVERRWFRRQKQGSETTLVPLAEGARLAVGDELEVQLSVTARAAAEYVHLRDPRPAGLEPDKPNSGWRWDLGIVRYEEVRDSGTNFFFEWLPAGEYTLKYRLRAATAGSFRAAPAQLQSMYAPEFVAYSAGDRLTIAP